LSDFISNKHEKQKIDDFDFNTKYLKKETDLMRNKLESRKSKNENTNNINDYESKEINNNES
jgi:hypothetical protein